MTLVELLRHTGDQLRDEHLAGRLREAADELEQLQAFRRLVADMRAQQKLYFQERDKLTLAQAKSLERKVDASIARADVVKKQRDLFQKGRPDANAAGM